MVQYLVTYSVQTGKEQQHDEWWRSVGRGFWQQRSGFRDLKMFTTMVGSGPDYVVEIDFDSGRNLLATVENQEAMATLEDFEHLVEDLNTKILIPTS